LASPIFAALSCLQDVSAFHSQPIGVTDEAT